jgi:hypothetical protein
MSPSKVAMFLDDVAAVIARFTSNFVFIEVL